MLSPDPEHHCGPHVPVCRTSGQSSWRTTATLEVSGSYVITGSDATNLRHSWHVHGSKKYRKAPSHSFLLIKILYLSRKMYFRYCCKYFRFLSHVHRCLLVGKFLIVMKINFGFRGFLDSHYKCCYKYAMWNCLMVY
jgi:hypothetical protein